MTEQEIQEIEAIHNQSILVAKRGLRKCAKWRKGLENGTPLTPSKKETKLMIDNAVSVARERFRKKFSS